MWHWYFRTFAGSAGRACRWATLALALLFVLPARSADTGAGTPRAENTAELLRRADGIRTSNYPEFAAILQQLRGQAAQLPVEQRHHLAYLSGWKSAYDGDYEAAVATLKPVTTGVADPTLRFRVNVTLANVLALSGHYDEAFLALNRLLPALPDISDSDAREQGLAVAAYLYNQVGEYDLGLSYADRLAAENTGNSVCRGGRLRLEALYKSGKLRREDPLARSVIDACVKQRDWLNANVVRTYVARLALDQGRFDEAVKLLKAHYDEVQNTQYPRLIAEFDALLAAAYRITGETELVRKFAVRAVDSGVRNQYTDTLVQSYRLLYLLAKERGDAKEALAFHEKYAVADKGYLDDVGTRQLAYQRVNHDAVAKKLQIDALNKQNQVLQLQQALGKKAVETGRLYIALLITVVAFIALWAYRTKRSQLHFMKLSRVDGLTGIANRHYFIAQAERTLDNSRKLQQEVCVVLCDLDHFKSINDKFGHAAGDHVLRQAVQACRAHLRSSDLFGRFGGEEFCILLPGCSLADARQRCEQLRISIATIATGAGNDASSVSASFGVANTGSSGFELRQLLAHADAALYQAKYAGRNCVVLYDTMHAVALDVTTDAELRIRGVGRA
jgi:diguanylate cyclase (GGDEF)-like protein